MFWEHEGNAAVRIGKWKLVRSYPGPWELYDMEATAPSCTTCGRPSRACRRHGAAVRAWARRAAVLDREKIVKLMASQGVTRAFWEK